MCRDLGPNDENRELTDACSLVDGRCEECQRCEDLESTISLLKVELGLAAEQNVRLNTESEAMRRDLAGSCKPAIAMHCDIRSEYQRGLAEGAKGVAWVACADGLPDSDITVMTFAPGSNEPIWPAYHDGEQWVDLNGSNIVDAPITHWMHFPDPPEGMTVEPPDFGLIHYGNDGRTLCNLEQVGVSWVWGPGGQKDVTCEKCAAILAGEEVEPHPCDGCQSAGCDARGVVRVCPSPAPSSLARALGERVEE